MKLALPLLVLLLLAACGGTETHIPIGGLFALTGYGAQWGSAEHQGALLAIEEANAQGGIDGTPLRLIAEDTRTDPTTTVTALRKLVNADSVRFVIGPTWEASTVAAAPLASELGIVLATPSAYKSIEDQHARTLFSTYPPYEHEIASLKGLFAEEGLSRFAIIADEEFFSETMVGIFEGEARKNNWTVAGKYLHPTGAHDYRTALLKIERQQADAIYAPLADDNDKGLLMRQLKETGLGVRVISTASTENPSLLKSHGDAIEGIIYPYPVEAQGYDAFSERYEARFGTEPESPSAATAYDAARLLVMALRSGAHDPEAVSAYLHDIDEFEGASGILTFDPNGIMKSKDHLIKTVCGGEFVRYEDCSFSSHVMQAGVEV